MRAASAAPTGILAELLNFGGLVKQAFSILVNLVANLLTLLICPVLVIAWIVRVRVLESRARRSVRTVRPGTAALAPPRPDLRLTPVAGGGK